MDGTSEWDGEKYGMTYIFGDLRDWYPTSGYRNRDKGNLAGLATTRTGHSLLVQLSFGKHDLLFLYFEKAQYGQTAPAAVFFEIRCGIRL